MAGVSLVDLDALLAERRSRKEAHERAIAEHREALVAIDLDLAALARIASLGATSQATAATAATAAAATSAVAAAVPAPPAHPPRRKSPPLRLDPNVERLSDEVRAALAEEIGGRAPLDALGHVVGRVGEIQAADAYYVLVAADLVNKKPSSGKSHVHKLLSASGRFVNVGGGRYRLRAEVAATEDASRDVQGE